MSRVVCLGDIAEVVRGVTYQREAAISSPSNGYIPVLRAGNIQDQLILNDDLVWVPIADVSDRQLLRLNDILMCTSSGSADVVGKSAVFDAENWSGSFGAFCAVIRAEPNACAPAFLKHVLRAPAFLRWARSSLGANIKNIRKSELELFQLQLPAHTEQHRIATILDKADNLRRSRQQAIRLADEFLMAAFFDLAGDPISNSRGWSERAISEIGIVTTGNTPDRSVETNFGMAIEWIKSDNINTSSNWLTTAREGLSAQGMKSARIVHAGSTLMTCIAGSPSCIGNVAMADRRVAFNQQINAVTPKEGIDSKFLYLLLLYSKSRIQAASTNSMKGMVSKGALEKVRLIWPPESLQNRIAKIFDKVSELRYRMEKAERLELYAALQAKLLS